MPGIVCVLGGNDPLALARRGAEPLRRRSWHRFEEVGGEGVALVFCGEAGGVARDDRGGLAAVDGELLSHDGPVPAGETAAALLEGHRSRGEQLEVPEGWFAGAVWDPSARELVLVTDRFGHRPLYMADVGGATVVASELKSLLAAGLEPALNLEAWAEMLAFEYPLGESVPLAGVESVPQASVLVVSSSGKRRLREHWHPRFDPDEGLDESEFLDELDRRLGRAVGRRLGAKTALALSSGLDSRTLAAIVQRQAPGTLTVTYGAPDSEDLVGGGKVAERARLPHRQLSLEPGYIARGAARAVWLAEGHVRCFHTHHLALRTVREDDGMRALLIGFAGDILLRGAPPQSHGANYVDRVYADLAQCVTDELVDEVLTQQFAAELRGRAWASFLRHLEAEGGPELVRRRRFSFRSNRRQMLWGSELFRDDLAPRDPFHDTDVTELCERIPERLRLDGRLHRTYLRRYPELAAVRNPKDGLPAHLVGSRRTAAALALRIRRGVQKAGFAVAGRSFVPRGAGLGDYATDLRHGSRELLGILLEPRTLERGQLRERGVRRLIDETLAGQARHTKSLGMLLTLELFQRQFLEGERPT